jgi:Ca2+/Na+ antiporter
MTAGSSIAAFVLGAAVSLVTSWVLVSRLERVGERLGLSEALLGMVAALAADAPEITASVTALAHHQRAVGAGVTIGSNVFNLAALLGLGAVVAGQIGFHRRVVVLGGTVALVIAAVCLLAVAGTIAAGTGLALVLVVLVPYAVLLGARRSAIERVGLPRRWSAWLTQAVAEEEIELEEAIRPRRGRPVDTFVALVAAVYLARRGRGAAALSTALNSNAINVTAGLLIPATIVGLSKPSASGLLVAGWYLGLTAVTLLLAYAFRGLHRSSGWAIIALYVLFVAALLVTA